MKKELLKLIIVSVLLTVLFVRCDDDDTPSYEQKVIENVELLNILKTKGVLTFEGNLLVMDDKVKELKELDLSGTKITDLSGLEIFPNLESVNLSNNELEQSFDFSKLPQTIKRVNLQDNDIYDYLGLIEVNFETAEMKVLRTFEEINLPATARYNMETLPFYSKESAATKLTMQNKETKEAEPYTTLREIPDELIRAFLKNSFSSIMTEEGKIDISRKLSTEQESIPFIVDMTFYYEPVSGPVDITVAESIEGVEYIINNPFYKGTQLSIKGKEEKDLMIAYFKPSKHIVLVDFNYINTPFVDWTNSEHLTTVIIKNNREIKEIDFSYSKLMMQREGGLDQSTGTPDAVRAYNCPELKSIKLPQEVTKPIFGIHLVNLANLSEFDMGKVTGFESLYLGDLPKLEKLNTESVIHTVSKFTGAIDEENGTVNISITENALEIEGVKELIVRFGKEGKIDEYSWVDMRTAFNDYADKVYDYRHLYANETTATKSDFQNHKNKRAHVDIEEIIKQKLLKERNKK